MTASFTINYCPIQIVFWMQWKKQHCLELSTKRKLHNNKDNSFRYFIQQCLVMIRKFLLLLLQRKMRLTEIYIYACKAFHIYHDCMKTWSRREGLPLYIWKWWVCYKCALNGYNVGRHVIAVYGQEASRVVCGDCDATSATNAACALGKQITSGISGKFILKQNMTRILISLKFRLVHTTVVIAIA